MKLSEAAFEAAIDEMQRRVAGQQIEDAPAGDLLPAPISGSRRMVWKFPSTLIRIPCSQYPMRWRYERANISAASILTRGF